MFSFGSTVERWEMKKCRVVRLVLNYGRIWDKPSPPPPPPPLTV